MSVEPTSAIRGEASRQRVQVLAESQRRAMARLAEARAEAQRIKQDAESDALKVLLAQQQEAEQLLERQLVTMSETSLSPEEESVLLAEHRKAAELLLQSQGEMAIHVASVIEGRIGIVLMNGSREAAAILMEAWMRVKDTTGTE